MPLQSEDRNIQHIAQELIALYCDEAELIAAGYADTMLDQGNIPAFEDWRKVMTAVRALQVKQQSTR